MKRTNFLMAIVLSGAIVFSGCSSLNNTAKGALIGTGGGAALGAALGALIGKDGKSTAIGAAIGTAVGASAGAIIGKKMDNAAAQAAAIEGAKTEGITDANGLQAVRVTFDSGILFASGKSALTTASKDALTKFAKILVENPTMDIKIAGHTDNAGWANSTAEQSKAKNKTLSEQRATAVADFLKTQKVPASQITEIIGAGEDVPAADNATAAGRAQNRRVEVYIYASEQMIKEAEAQAK